MDLIQRLQDLKGTIRISHYCGVLKAALIPDADSPYSKSKDLMVSSGQNIDHVMLRLVAQITGDKDLYEEEKRQYGVGIDTKPFYNIEDPLLKEMLHPGNYLILDISFFNGLVSVQIEKIAYSHHVMPGFYIQSAKGFNLERAIGDALKQQPRLAKLSI